MRLNKRLNPDLSNAKIAEIINNNVLITRVGLGGETAISALSLNNIPIPQHVFNWFYINAGFYGNQNYINYAKMYKNACDNSDLHAYWNFEGFVEMEDFLVPESK